MTAPEKEKHEYLVGLLKDSRYHLIDFMFKQAAVLTLLIGWVLSSDKARDFIATAHGVRTIAVVAVSLYCALLIFWACTYRLRSVSAYAELVKLQYMPKHFYGTLLVTKPLAASLICIHVVACVVLVLFLLRVQQTTADTRQRPNQAMQLTANRTCDLRFECLPSSVLPAHQPFRARRS
jgi:hypothetical protein